MLFLGIIMIKSIEFVSNRLVFKLDYFRSGINRFDSNVRFVISPKAEFDATL